MAALGEPLGDRVPQGPARRGGRVCRAGHRLRARAALLQVLSRAGRCRSTSPRSRSSTTTATRCSAQQPPDDDGVPDPPDRVVLPRDRPGRRPALAVLPVDDPRAGRPARLRADARRGPRRSARARARVADARGRRAGELQDLAHRHGLRRRHDLRRSTSSADLAPCRIEEIVRLEPLIERLILDVGRTSTGSSTPTGPPRRPARRAASSA